MENETKDSKRAIELDLDTALFEDWLFDQCKMTEEGKGAMPKRNFENYRTRHEAFLVYQELHDSRKCPYWFEGEHQKSAFVVDFDEWLWLPAGDNPAKPVEWKRKYLGEDYGN